MYRALRSVTCSTAPCVTATWKCNAASIATQLQYALTLVLPDELENPPRGLCSWRHRRCARQYRSACSEAPLGLQVWQPMPYNCSSPLAPGAQENPSKSRCIPAGIRHGRLTVPVNHQLQSVLSDMITPLQSTCSQAIRQIKPERLLRRPTVHTTVNLMSFHTCKNASVRRVLFQQAATRLFHNDLDAVFKRPPH